MDALLQGGPMLWTSHLGLIGGGEVLNLSLKDSCGMVFSQARQASIFWTDIVWTSHLGLIGGEGGSFK